jgi:hypothetical protein
MENRRDYAIAIASKRLLGGSVLLAHAHVLDHALAQWTDGLCAVLRTAQWALDGTRIPAGVVRTKLGLKLFRGAFADP